MEERKLLLMRLEGPLQSWGEHSKWDYRDCAAMPTKSGIIGLLGCALGIRRGNAALEKLSASVTVAVRADRAGRLLSDFHTVHADRSQGERIINAKGDPRGDTIVTHRSYFQDASFLVVVAGEDRLLAELDTALRAPCWPLYLGRRSCVPSVPVYMGCTTEYAGPEDALNHVPPAARADAVMQYEVESTDGSGYLRPDELEDAAHRRYAMRRVMHGAVERKATT